MSSFHRVSFLNFLSPSPNIKHQEMGEFSNKTTLYKIYSSYFEEVSNFPIP